MIERRLRNETIKLLNKIKIRRKCLEGNKTMLNNIDAYISDTSYFLKKKKFLEAFEAIIWAWAWLEILEQLGYLKKIK